MVKPVRVLVDGVVLTILAAELFTWFQIMLERRRRG